MRMIEVGFLIEASSAAILLRRVTAEQSGNNSSDHATAEGIMAFFSFPQSSSLADSAFFPLLRLSFLRERIQKMRNETLFNRIENMGIYALHQIFNRKKVFLRQAARFTRQMIS